MDKIEYLRYELIDPIKNAKKFWEVALVDNCCLIRYARIGAAHPREEVFRRATQKEAQKYADKKKDQKFKKGYKYVGIKIRDCFIPGLKYAAEQLDLSPEAGDSGDTIKKVRNLEIEW